MHALRRRAGQARIRWQEVAMQMLHIFRPGACKPLGFALTFACALAASPAAFADGFYKQRNLVSDGTIPAAHVDPNLVNGWGVAFNPYGFVWVADADGTVSTLYDGNGVVNRSSSPSPLPR
jgi:hypothetical protein